MIRNLVLFFIISAFLIHYFLRPSLEHSTHAPETGNYFDLPFGRTRYTDYGSKNSSEIIVFIHGISEYSNLVFHSTAQLLVSKGFRVITFDLYGRGYSASPDMKYDDALFVSQLVHLLLKLDVGTKQPITLVGLSLGGGVAVSYTATFPSTVKNLILIATVGFPIELPFIANFVKLPVVSEFVSHFFGLTILKERVKPAFPDPEKFIDIIELIKNGYEFQSKLNPHYLVSVGQTIKDFPFGTLQPKFQQVAKISHLKTLILWGDQDKTVPLTHAKIIKEIIPNSKLVIFENCGHSVMHTVPNRVFQEIYNFLSNSSS